MKIICIAVTLILGSCTANHKTAKTTTTTPDYGMRIFDPRIGHYISIDNHK